MELYKRCAHCGLEKPLSEFWKHKPCRRQPDGLQPNCKECSREIYKEWAAEHPERITFLRRRWISAHRTKFLNYLKEYWNEYKNGLRRKGRVKGSVLGTRDD